MADRPNERNEPGRRNEHGQRTGSGDADLRGPAGGGPGERARAGDEQAVDVVVEVPRGSRNKYEYDHERHVIRLDRRLFSATVYPADYGFIPGTLGEDGDPLDALVLLDEPTFPGCVILAKPIGLFSMVDEKGPDAKVITVACGDPLWERTRSLEELPPHLTQEISHFFDVYKDLEADKGTEVRGFDGADAAWTEIQRARERARRYGSPG